jgi:hypothetical protein
MLLLMPGRTWIAAHSRCKWMHTLVSCCTVPLAAAVLPTLALQCPRLSSYIGVAAAVCQVPFCMYVHHFDAAGWVLSGRRCMSLILGLIWGLLYMLLVC